MTITLRKARNAAKKQMRDKRDVARRNGSPAADMDKVRQAARQSGAEGFIAEWAGQYEQMVGREFPEGIDPSKGQLQKLALARWSLSAA